MDSQSDAQSLDTYLELKRALDLLKHQTQQREPGFYSNGEGHDLWLLLSGTLEAAYLRTDWRDDLSHQLTNIWFHQESRPAEEFFTAWYGRVYLPLRDRECPASTL
jgi:hypothetical protein